MGHSDCEQRNAALCVTSLVMDRFATLQFGRRFVSVGVASLLLAAASCSHPPARSRPRSEADVAVRHEPTGEWITIEGSRAYLAMPRDAHPPMPGILVFHTARGLTRDIQLWTDRLAEEGYAALAVDFYRGRATDDVTEAIALRNDANQHRSENRAMVRSAYDLLAADPRIRANRRALVGWSYGGGWATLLASQWSGLSAVVAYYGVSDLDEEAVANIGAPVLLLCGTQDDTAEDVAAFEAALKGQRKAVQTVWNGEGHNFAEPSNPRYSPRASNDAYREVRNFLRRTLHE